MILGRTHVLPPGTRGSYDTSLVNQGFPTSLATLTPEGCTCLLGTFLPELVEGVESLSLPFPESDFFFSVKGQIVYILDFAAHIGSCLIAH